ncbi:hypothetical protein PDESU_03611 [Pontiella desulfatans]|uniref:Uncharacterized protein n=1 Tax=Pontiella desulfatans TaxID=2750659 RepID=A0A6C2U681_PONDE|nr:hypothetical protein PDESU_03611 [Pontiella desulfatans]
MSGDRVFTSGYERAHVFTSGYERGSNRLKEKNMNSNFTFLQHEWPEFHEAAASPTTRWSGIEETA